MAGCDYLPSIKGVGIGKAIDLFNEGLSFLEEALLKLRSGKDVELAAEDLRLARASLDEVVGIKTSDSLLGDIVRPTNSNSKRK